MPATSRNRAKKIIAIAKPTLPQLPRTREKPAEARPAQARPRLVLLSLLLVATVSAASYDFYRVGMLEEKSKETLDRLESRIEKLDSEIEFDSKRQHLALKIRDEIQKANPRLSPAAAYRYSDLILRAGEKYPAVSPLLLLAIGIVESGYDARATSSANARGLYQILPSTGRLLCRTLAWEFTDAMLYDPEKNTEMAALYLDVLFAAHRDPQLVLAEYNGGPLNAGYFRAGSDRTAAETRDYVLRVLDIHNRLKKELGAEPQTSVSVVTREATVPRLPYLP